MSYEFYDDFSFHDEAGKPYNILIERNSDLGHGHATVKDNEYHIMVPGNKHLAQTPPLKNFQLELQLAIATPNLNDTCQFHNFGFRIFFRYDRFLKQGYILTGLFSDRSLSVELAALNVRDEKTILSKNEAALPAPFDYSDFKVSLQVNENRFVVQLNDAALELDDANQTFPLPGYIGLDKSFYSGELIVRQFRLVSADNVAKATVAGPLTLKIPCVHGMSVPYCYTLNLSKYENGPYELDVALSGGIKDRPDRGPCGAQWCHEIDRIKNPYLRLDSPAGEVKNIVLYNGLMTMLDREEKRDWMIARDAGTSWPLKRKIYLDALPDPRTLVFAAGYEYFENDPQGFLAGGPFEVVADSRGNLLYQGPSLRRGLVACSVKSPENKWVVARIPQNIPDREKALRHARNNHYFYEREPIRFFINLCYHADLYSAGEFNLSARLQSVYGDNLDNKVRLSVAGHEGAPVSLLKDKLGIDCLGYAAEIDGVPATGVYHLAVKLTLGNKPLYDDVVILEVMSDRPDALPPPVASGLPLLFSLPTEIKYLETDAFDPRVETAGAMHYFGMCGYYPEYARQKRIWELLKFYNRKWCLMISERTPSRDLSIEQNRDIIAQCDFLQISLENNPRHGRNDLWMFDNYKDTVLDVLIDFFKSQAAKSKNPPAISMELLEETRARKTYLPETAFEALVDCCWKEWLEYFAVRFAESLKRQHDQLKQINPTLGRSSGGPFSVYVAHNKSAYFANYFGYNRRAGTTTYFDGFWQFEDYPHSCGYSMTRATFGLMTIKQHFPEGRVFPEIYSTHLWDGCSDGAVSQAHPPFGFYDLPVAIIRERIYEFAFATAWFKDKTFHYWRDYGFHTRGPDMPFLRELIGAWGNVLKHQPVRPVKTTGFLVDMELIAKHPDYYERHCNVHTPWKDVNNTAEEALAYTYHAARQAGLAAGFTTSLDELGNLNPEDLDLLVLPPLPRDLPADRLEAVRALHRQGVSLLGFETVHGLEDLFGVTLLGQDIRIRKIGVAPGSIPQLCALENEYAEHERCRAWYTNAGAAVILAGAQDLDGPLDVPVLVTKETQWGKTAFFNIPPTVVKRDSFIERVGFGQECLSALIKVATASIINQLSAPCISARGAKVIAFHDEKGDIIVIVEEESLCPEEEKYPRPFLLNIKLPGIKSGGIICDRDYSVAVEKPGNIVLRLSLGQYESALFILKHGKR